MKKILIMLLLILPVELFAQSSQWVTGYFPTWWYGTLAANAFEWGSLTNVVMFPAQDALASSPYFDESTLNQGGNLATYVNAAHAKNVKVLISVCGGYGQTNMPVVAADAAKCSTFVVTACAWAKAHNCDGIEIDWEFPRSTDGVGWNQLIRLFRIELDKWSPRGLMMTSVNYTGPQSPPYYKDSMMVFDQMLHMSYTMWMGATQEGPYTSGFDTPVNQPTQFSSYPGTSLTGSGLQSWISAGYPASKMAVGIAFESTIFTGPTTMGQSYSAWQFGSVATQSIGSGYPSVPTSGRQYDATAQAAWCVNGGKVYSYQDTNSVKAIVAWAKNRNYGGIMVYDFPAGQDNAATPKDNLLRVVAREAFAGTSTPVSYINITPVALSYGEVLVNLTVDKSYSISASGLTPASGNIVVTAPSSAYQVSLTAGSGFGSSINVPYSGGALSSPLTIYVRFLPTALQSYSGSITNNGGGASQNVSVTGTGVSALTPALNADLTSLSFGNVSVGDISDEQTYVLTGSNLSPANGTITVTAPSTAYQVSLTTGTGFGSSVTVPYSGGTLSSPYTIFVRFLPTVVQSYQGNITNTGGGDTLNIAVSGAGISSTVPTLIVDPSALSFDNIMMNDTSAEKTYIVSASNLIPANGRINISAPSGFAVSRTTGKRFGPTISISYSNGILSARTIYVRFSPTVIQSYSGSITNGGGGATTQNVIVTGTCLPSLTVNPVALTFGNVVINTTSNEQVYLLSGFNLLPASGNITITAPSTAYQVSLITGSGFGSSIHVPYSGGAISSSDTIFVRFLPTANQSYPENISNTGGGASTQTAVTGAGVSIALPTLAVNPVSVPFGDVIINTSSERFYTFSGSNLLPANGIDTVKAPTGFQVSITSGTGFSSSLTVTHSEGLLAATKIYIRFSPVALQNYSGNIDNIGGGATKQIVSVTGRGVSASAPLLAIDPSSLMFNNVPINTISIEKTYTLSGSNLLPANGNDTVTAPIGFQVSTASGIGFSSSLSVAHSGGVLPSTTIYVRFSPTVAQTYNGIITNIGGGAGSQDVVVSGTGESAVPAGSLSSNSLSLTFGCVTTNAISGEKSYELSGTNLIPQGSITITSSRGFQVSASSSAGYDSSISISYSNDTLSSRPIYIRFIPTAAENYTGNITNIGGGADALVVAVSGTGLPLNIDIQLGQNFPNPFNSYTRIPYSLFKKSWVKLTIFNMLGQRISTLINEEQDVGYYQPEFDLNKINNNNELTSGIYFYRLDIEGRSLTKKLLLLK